MKCDFSSIHSQEVESSNLNTGRKLKMKRVLTTATMALVFFLGPVAASNHNALAHSDEPVLLKATFFSHTKDEDKDHDTGIYVKVTTSDGSSIIAHADNRDNSGDDGTQYKDGSDHQFDLEADGVGMAKSSCKGFNVRVMIHTHGNDTWRFNGRVVLQFSDKSNLVASRDSIELKNDGASTDWSAPK